MTNIFCDIHGQQYPRVFLNIIPDADEQNKANFKLFCNKCIMHEQFKEGYLVCLDDLNKADKSNQVIDNWPPMNNRNILQEIKNILSCQDDTYTILELLEQRYHQVKQIVNEKIDEYYKYQLKIVNMFSKSYLSEVYSKFSNLENFQSCFNRESFFDLNKFQDILNDQSLTMQFNSQVFEFIIKQCTTIKKSGLNFFDTLIDKLEILFEKTDSAFINKYQFINIADEENLEKIEKTLFIEYANQNLAKLHEQINFQWQTFEEILNGIQISLHEKNVFFTKGYEIPQNIEDLDQQNLKHPYRWWIQVTENLGSRIQVYSKQQILKFSKKAKDYFKSDSIKGKQKIFHRQSSQYSKDYISDALVIAKTIQSKAQEINDKYSQFNMIF